MTDEVVPERTASVMTMAMFIDDVMKDDEMNPEAAQELPRPEYEAKLKVMQKEFDEKDKTVEMPVQQSGEKKEDYMTRLESWLEEVGPKLKGQQFVITGDHWKDTALDEKGDLFKVQITRFDSQFAWSGEYSKSRKRGALFVVEMSDRLLREQPIALRGKGSCAGNYLAARGLNPVMPESPSKGKLPAFLTNATRKRKRKAPTGLKSKGSKVLEHFDELDENDPIRKETKKTHLCKNCAALAQSLGKTKEQCCFK